MLGVQSLGPIVPRFASDAGLAPEPADSGVATARAASGAEQPVPSEAIAEIERDAWVVLLSVSGLGPVSFGSLLAAFGSARAVLDLARSPSGPRLLVEALAEAASDVDAGDAAVAGTQVEFDCGAAAGDVEPPAGPGLEAGRRRTAIGLEFATRICEAASGSGVLERIRALGLRVVTVEEASYPERLRRVDLPPPLLFVRGSVEAMSAGHAVAIVGTRCPTDKGRLIAAWIGSAIARTGASVVSGLAVGIDGAAHAAVVGEGGRTVAVLGGGHARLFPKAHERLADAIVEAGGAVVSELAPDTSPSRGTFPRRNRLVSGLSDATVVVEAGRRSGALITAGWALEQGRECFLVPGPLDAPASAGCLEFLRSYPGQARVVAGVAELVEDLGLDGQTASVSEGAGPGIAHSGPSGSGAKPSASAGQAGPAAVLASLGPVERALAEQLAAGAATADQLAARTALPGASVLSALTLLELRGLVSSAYGRYSPCGPLASWSGRHRERPG